MNRKKINNVLFIFVISMVLLIGFNFNKSAVVNAEPIMQWVKFGDLNQDGLINITDTVLIGRHMKASEDAAVYAEHPDWILTGKALLAADVDDDGDVDSADSELISWHIGAEKSDDLVYKRIVTVDLRDSSGIIYDCFPVIYDEKSPASSKYPLMISLSMKGYTFLGWYTAESSKITAGSVMSKNSDHHLYAKWQINSYTLTYHANGGNCSTASKTVTYNSTYGTLPTPTRTGYTFLGWYTASSGGSQVTSSTRMAAANTTIYAHWKINTYTLNYHANGGVCGTASKTVTYNSTYGTLPTPTRTGYTFLGWYTASSGGSQVTSSTRMAAANTTIYAHWKINTYTLNYHANDGVCGTASKTVTYNSTYGTLPTPTRTGYTFLGWYTASSGGSQVTSGTKMAEANTTIYAHWKANTYKLVFDANGGSCSTASKNIVYGNTYGSLPTPTKSRYVFLGWYTQKSNGTKILSTDINSYAGNRTVYALWKAETSIALNKTSISVYKGATYQLKATVTGKSTAKTWTSSNRNVATVSSTGKITAKKAGTATITVKVNGFTKKCTVKVVNPTIQLNKKTTAIAVNGSETLTVTVKGPSKTVKWTSSNTKVAKISSAGKITGVGAGTATIYATANGVKASCKVTVIKLVAPTLSNWTKTQNSTDSVKYTAAWNRVNGASGYNVYFVIAGDIGNRQTIYTVKNSYSYEFGNNISAKLNIKVRAYKDINGKRIYGPWSSVKSKYVMSENEMKNWYKSVLSDTTVYKDVLHQDWTSRYKKNVSFDEFNYYYVTDINNDGINELLLATNRDKVVSDYRVLIVTNYNGKITPLICFVGTGYARVHIKKYGKNIVFFDSNSSEAYTTEYQINNGKIVKVADAQYTNYKYKKEYRVKGKLVSYSYYQSYLSRYSSASEIDTLYFYSK